MLSESENMDYFAIETIKMIVTYQWNIIKPRIIMWLFIPFILNMVTYNIYCTYSYELIQESKNSEGEKDSSGAINIMI